jgi:hypothetical protein
MAEDEYVRLARLRSQQLAAERQQAIANLSRAVADEDETSGTFYVQQVANLDAEASNLNRLHQQHMAAQNPPAPAPQSDQEWLSKSPERMDWSDAFAVAGKSKYGVDVEAFKQGIAEVQRRRARGE